jgi:hypothetical protein
MPIEQECPAKNAAHTMPTAQKWHACVACIAPPRAAPITRATSRAITKNTPATSRTVPARASGNGSGFDAAALARDLNE